MTSQPEADQCWCCGCTDEPDRMVHLGNHPEVALCTGCARWAANQAWEIDDRDATSPAVRLRTVLRSGRRVVVERGWHRNRVVGGVLRRIGRHLP